MRKIIMVLVLLSTVTVSAQKIKLKEGIVYVNKEPFLKYEGNSYYTFDMVRLFSITNEVIKVEDDQYNSNVTKSRRNPSDSQQLSGTSPITKKKKFRLVKFAIFDLEFETTLSKTKILKEFYQKKVVNAKGLIDQNKAQNFATIRHKNVSGTREKI